MKEFKGKAIYQPSGKAAEYSKWAVNFYNGCSARCEYCYNRHGITAKVLGGDTPTLKKSLGVEGLALEIFKKELDQNQPELQKHGLFFNFVSDPCLPETWELNSLCMRYAIVNMVPVKILTKQTWWIGQILHEIEENETIWNIYNAKQFFAIGFTLTGHDELEPGAATNADRIRAMKVLYDEGFKTWASIEPIIDIDSSMKMIGEICNHVDLIKVGLQSGKKYLQFDLKMMVRAIEEMTHVYGFKVYFKDSLLKAINANRYPLGENEVDSDFNIFNS